MIIVKDCKYIDATLLHVKLYADAISELTNGPIEGIPEGYKIQPGSFAYDVNGNVAIYSSEGTWNTVE